MTVLDSPPVDPAPPADPGPGPAPTSPHLLTRHATEQVEAALEDTRIVVVQGARQVGKSTLAEQVMAARPGRFVTLDDDTIRAAAKADPLTFVRQLPHGTLGIDEVQRVPELVVALKQAVDADRRPGRFLLTGSANLLRLGAVGDSLAGRAETVDLFGFSQGELAGRREDFVDRLLDGDLMTERTGELSRREYMLRICTGGYPEALTRADVRRRAAWLDNYLRRVVERDAAEVSGAKRRTSELPRLLRLIAAGLGGELNVARLGMDAGIPVRTLPPYLDLLETLYLVHRIPGWSTDLTERVVQRPRIALLDTGLAARLVNADPLRLTDDLASPVAAGLLTAFVAAEVRKQIGWSQAAPQLMHFRDRDGAVVDLVLESPDGRVAAVHVKASATVDADDMRWLALLAERLGPSFTGGVLLHLGTAAVPFGPNLAALPVSALWG